jgi:hypothetical protein
VARLVSPVCAEELPVNSPSDPYREEWLTQRRAVPAAALGAAPALDAVIDGRAQLTPALERLDYAAADEFRAGTFIMIGSDHHGDIDVDSVAVAEVRQPMPDGPAGRPTGRQTDFIGPQVMSP